MYRAYMGLLNHRFFLLKQDSQAMKIVAPRGVEPDVHGVSLARQNHLGLHSDAGGGNMRGNSGFCRCVWEVRLMIFGWRLDFLVVSWLKLFQNVWIYHWGKWFKLQTSLLRGLGVMYCLVSTIPESNSSPLKITGLKTIFSFLGWPIFRCFVSFRECKSYLDLNHRCRHRKP